MHARDSAATGALDLLFLFIGIILLCGAVAAVGYYSRALLVGAPAAQRDAPPPARTTKFRR